MGDHDMCFECLQKSIQTDFSEKLIFRHGISDSVLPFASRAVVQIDLNNKADKTASEELSPQFILLRVTNHDNKCLSKFIVGQATENDTEDHVHGNGNSGLAGICQLHAESNAEVSKNDDESLSSSEENPQCSVKFGSKTSTVELNKSSTEFSSELFSSRMVSAFSPIAYVGTGSYSVIENIICKYLSGSVEDHVMASFRFLLEGEPTDQYGADFLNLVGIPTFAENGICKCARHPNIAPVLGMLNMPGSVNLLYPKTPYSLENILHYSPKALKTDWHIRFLIYQILSALAYIHDLGVAHGNICPSNVMLTDSCWVWLNVCDEHRVKTLSLRKQEVPVLLPSETRCCMRSCPCQALYADLKLSPSIDWRSDFKQWWRGELSNFDYLLLLNKLAGRRWGDHTFHTVMPWVIDFSVKPDENSNFGWRDLRKSKWRLAKGDEQLDFTFSTSEIPHHVSDECLSELAVCSYKARRLPLSVLRSAVRSVYEPNEYPSSMQRLYQWTPDECIPEFYSDPRIFTSLHSGMSDLTVPAWANSPEEFISLHRDALECDRVSQEIHHWIDITFGYKMSDEAAVDAKNVMLPTQEPIMPRSMGRRQLFTRPHPMRRGFVPCSHNNNESVQPNCEDLRNNSEGTCKVASEAAFDPMDVPSRSLLLETDFLKELEEATSFCEYAQNLNPIYGYQDNSDKSTSAEEPPNEPSRTPGKKSFESSDIDLSCLLEYLEANDSGSKGFHELLLWRHKSLLGSFSEDTARDIFSVGCMLAELYLNKPLFTTTTLAAYIESGVFPGLTQELPPYVRLLVEACIQRDKTRRPSAKCLLESPYFPSTVRSAYLFLCPLHLLAGSESRVQYAAKFAREGALKSMGAFAAEMCAPYCLPLITTPLSDVEAGSALYLLTEFLKCLKPQAVKTLILPAIQKILQATDYSLLKVFLLQNSFAREVWKSVGKQVYLGKMHPLVISNLYASPHKNSASAASVLLIGSCEELGIPIAIHQTILPLIHCFGKGLCSDGIDALVRIGGLLGENFIIRQLLPLLRNVIRSCIDSSFADKPEPLQSWNALALIDSLVTLDGLATVLPIEVVLKELIQDQVGIHVKILMQTQLDLRVLQVAATTLISICQRIGPDCTVLHVMPQLKELFDELAFSQDITTDNGSFGRNLKVSKSKMDELAPFESRMDLVLLLYPFLASLLGIEKLRQCCSTWLLLEQFLQRFHNWKWEYTAETSRSVSEHLNPQRPVSSKISPSEYNPAKLLLNGVGWSIPQSQGVRAGKSSMHYKQVDYPQQTPAIKNAAMPHPGKREPWFWFPSPVSTWDGSDSLGRVGNLKDELPWKIRASILYSVRAHPGALRKIAICHDECTVFTGGVGPGFKGTVQKWELPRMDCISGYYGHEEVVNDICLLSSGGRIASCDGTIHVWNSQTGKLISAYAEPPTNSLHLTSSLSTVSKVNTEQTNMLNSNTLSGGILSSDGSLYTCMHQLESDDKLVVGMGNGSLRFIDITHDQKLHLWKSDAAAYSFSSFVSAICSCGSEKLLAEKAAASSSWIAAGLSSGHCRLLDARSGDVIAFWRAHDGYITKLAAPEDHLVVSSSLDKTLRVWDLRRNFPPVSNVFKGHADGISDFSVWGQDVISVSRNKIGLSSLSRSSDSNVEKWLSPQKLYSADRGTRNLSVLSSIIILPFSRLFLIGTEDGYLKICC
ncbi:hypothetical protein AAC387_Pa10g2131 [Persea americana]